MGRDGSSAEKPCRVRWNQISSATTPKQCTFVSDPEVYKRGINDLGLCIDYEVVLEAVLESFFAVLVKRN